jgi:hypothetical protein
MDILEKVIQEWSHKTNKGYPDINSKEDMDLFESMFGFRLNKEVMKEEEEQEEVSVEDIKKLIDSNKDNSRLMTRIYRTLIASDHIIAIKNRFNQAGITKDTFDNRNIHDELINILQKGNQSDIQTFLNIVSNSKIPEKGNLADKLTGLPKDKINKIANITGAKSSTAMGKGEILFPILFSDVTLRLDGKGDFTVNNKPAELKSNLARLSGERTDVQYVPVNDGVPTTWTKSLQGDVIAGKQNNTLDQVIENINNFIKSNYRNTSLRIDEKSINNPVAFMANAAIDSYIRDKGIGTYILFNSKNLDFRTFEPATKIIDAINAGEVSFTAKTHPQLTGFKV